jgi:type IV secretion system protein VirB6
MNDLKVFSFIADRLIAFLDIFIVKTFSTVIIELTPVAIAALTLYLTIYGYMIMTGRIQEPMSDALLKCIKIGFIVAFALVANTYQEIVIGGFNALEAKFMSFLGGSGNAFETLDKSFTTGMQRTVEALSKAGIIKGEFGFYLAAVAIFIVVLALCLIAAGMMLVAKVAVALLLGLGPLFILALLFPVTARFFDAWLSQLMNYLFLLLFAVTTAGIAVTFIDGFIADSILTGQVYFNTAQIVGAGFLLVFLLKQVPSIASGVAGGISLQTAGLSQMMSPVTRPARYLGQNQTRRNADGSTESHSRLVWAARDTASGVKNTYKGAKNAGAFVGRSIRDRSWGGNNTIQKNTEKQTEARSAADRRTTGGDRNPAPTAAQTPPLAPAAAAQGAASATPPPNVRVEAAQPPKATERPERKEDVADQEPSSTTTAAHGALGTGTFMKEREDLAQQDTRLEGSGGNQTSEGARLRQHTSFANNPARNAALRTPSAWGDSKQGQDPLEEYYKQQRPHVEDYAAAHSKSALAEGAKARNIGIIKDARSERKKDVRSVKRDRSQGKQKK